MNIELEYQKETGLPSRKRNTGNPHSYTNEYIEWLEQQVKLLHLHNVNGSISAKAEMINALTNAMKINRDVLSDYHDLQDTAFMKLMKIIESV